MNYFITFIEGIITFISPCILPMLPLYAAYFAGSEGETAQRDVLKILTNAIGFVVGFTLVFVLLGAAAGSFGKLIRENMKVLTIIGGGILILFGLSHMELLEIGFMQRTKRIKAQIKPAKFFSAVLFGFIFGFSWTPCVGTFLGSAMLLAAQSGSSVQGILMLLVYSMGLGIPFILAALLINQLETTFDFIKRHYQIITYCSGLILIVMGIMMMTGNFNVVLALFTFK